MSALQAVMVMAAVLVVHGCVDGGPRGEPAPGTFADAGAIDHGPRVAATDRADAIVAGVGDGYVALAPCGVAEDCDGDGFIDGLGIQGGGCATGGGGGGASLLVIGVVVIGRRRRRAAVVLAAAIASVPAIAAAQVGDARSFPVERFELASDRDGLFDVEWAEARGDMAIDVALWAGYSNDPLLVYTSSNHERVGSLVDNRLGASLVAAFSPARWVSLGFEMPLIVSQDREPGAAIAPMGLDSLSSFGTGNLRLIPKFTLLRQATHGVGLALIPVVLLPTASSSSDYFGDHGVSAAPALALSRRWEGVRLAIAVGYRARANTQVLNLRVRDELFARVGLGFQLSAPAELGLTTSLATPAAEPFGHVNANHLESLLGVSYRVASPATVFGGAGVGWENGFGTPDWRTVIGIRIASAETKAQ